MTAAGTTGILSLLAICALGCGVLGCAGGGSRPSAHVSTDPPARDVAGSRPASSEGYLKSDSDTDSDDRLPGPSNDDQGEMVAVGAGASRSDWEAISPVVRSYFKAAAAGDGAKGCSLLASNLAASVGEGNGPNGSASSGTCAAALSLFFKHQHQHFAAENVATMVVTGVHVKDAAAWVTLGFKATPEGEVVLQREGPTWKIDALADSQLP